MEMNHKGKQLAIWGLVLQLGSVPLHVCAIIAMVGYLSGSADPAQPSAMAQEIGGFLGPIVAGYFLGWIGVILVLVAFFKARYRAPWFRMVLWVLSILWLMYFPVGTAIGVIVISQLARPNVESAPRMKNRTIAIIAAVLALVWPLVVSPNVTTVVIHMFRYGDFNDMAPGLAISALIAFWASRRMRRSFRVMLIAAAIPSLWSAMYITACAAHRTVRGADTGPIFFLVAGWVPSWGIVYLLMLLFQRIFPSKPVPPPPLPSQSTATKQAEQAGAEQPTTRYE
jgi:hypothetical protein